METIVEAPGACIDCIFNHDGIECRAFPERYDEEYDVGLRPEYERPEWCDWANIIMKFNTKKEEV